MQLINEKYFKSKNKDLVNTKNIQININILKKNFN